MKKFFLIPLMACLVCLYAGAAVVTVPSDAYADLQTAFNSAPTNSTIQLAEDIEVAATVKISKAESDPSKTFILDLNGHKITTKSGVKNTIELYKGALTIRNSVPTEGSGIYNNNDQAPGKYNSEYNTIMVFGTYQKNCNPKEADVTDLFTFLNLETSAYVEATVNAITINSFTAIKDAQQNVINKGTCIYASGTGVANGVRVDLQGKIEAGKYGIKANGTLGYPDATKHGTYFNSVKENFYGVGTTETIQESDKNFSPFIHIFPTAIIHVSDNVKKATAVYCSGYARWLIEGDCSGSTGVYTKSGQVTLNDAIVQSTYTGNTATISLTNASGIETGGNAVVVESNSSYPGGTEVVVTGDSKITTPVDNGTALTEVVKPGSQTEVESITINGGVFSGDNSIAISDQTASSTEAEVTIYGTTIEGEITIGDDGSIDDLLPDNVHTTIVEDENGKATVIISEGEEPEAAGLTPEQAAAGETNSWAQVAAVSDKDNRKNVAWTGIDSEKGEGTIAENAKVYLGELQIISGDEDNLQKLTIESGAELNVSQLILNKYARIIVKPNGRLIVTGEQGMHAPSNENIVLESSDVQPAYFMFHPNVTSNRHPKAQIQFHSRGYQKPMGEQDVEGGKFQWQRFGVPSWKPINLKECIAHLPAKTQFQRIVNDDPANYNMWEILSKEDNLVPFTSYAMTSQSTTEGIVYTFGCEIVGNGDVELKLYEHYNYFSNSYTAPIDIKKLIKDFKDNYPHLQATVYLNDPVSNWWYELNNSTYFFYDNLPTTIEPMQAFSFMRNAAGVNPKIDYNTEIWTPMMSSSSGAPARAREQSFGSARIEITAADGTKDAVCLAESDEFSSEFDNSYDAEKFIYEGKTLIYANGCYDKMGIHATNNLEGTTFGITTNDQTSFMMSFDHVKGVNYAIRDMLTGTETEIAEGATYMFSVPADATIENRFQIVKVKKVPTAIENTIEENTRKGIYTMTGLYVGNDFHSLPAGVYVVDGKKIVK